MLARSVYTDKTILIETVHGPSGDWNIFYTRLIGQILECVWII